MKILTHGFVQIPLIILFALFAPLNSARASFKVPQYRSQSVEVIDIHQHVGDASTMGPLGKQFVLSNLPNWLPMGFKNWSLDTYANLVLQPYTPIFGTRASCISAGLSMCGLMAVYAPLTWGTYDNDSIIKIIDDVRNRGPNGELSYFFGMASLNVHRFPDNASEEIANLRKALAHPWMKGIKLAFVHNELPMDDQQFDEIYKVAQELNVPVYHHIGTSPIRRMKDFPSDDARKNYLRAADPTALEWAIAKYPNVPFILGHMGFDFNKEGVDFSEEVYKLAEKYPNVYFEISAFGLAMYDKDGKFMDGALRRLKDMNVVDRILYGSDASGQPGATGQYVQLTLKSMDRVGYSLEQARAVMSENARRIYRLPK
ncbi:MAG: amidohydrolase family protein [Silvanigrellaceae bacterium]